MSHDTDAHCHCVTKHNPKPAELHRHHVWPLGEGGPDVDANLLWLCPTTHANVHELWRIYKKHNGRPPWTLLRTYSDYARRVVEEGRRQMQEAKANVNSDSASTVAA